MTRDGFPEAAFLLLLLAFLATLLVLAAPTARASADVSIQGYDSGGGFTPIGDGGSMPVGATLEIRVWVDLYACDPVAVNWGDGNIQTQNYGGSFAKTWTHTYAQAGTYRIQAGEPCGGTGTAESVTVGGAGNLLDPSSPMFPAVAVGAVGGLGALGLAAGATRAAAKPPTTPPGGAPPLKPVPRPHLRPGIPGDWMLHHVSYRDIPVGAPRQPPPTIQMRPGEPTNLNQRMHCPWCGGDLGWVAGGWFCLNPGCTRLQAETRIVHGL